MNDTAHREPAGAAGDVVIVGGGPVGHRLAERLRQHGHEGSVTMLDTESPPAYHRVLLTSVLDGSLDPAALELPPVPRARSRRGVTVTGIDRQRRRVWTGTGEYHRYDTLVLATGAEPHMPQVPGIRTASGQLVDGVTGLRSLADCDRISGDEIVVLGGGPLGLEAAAALRRSGRNVSLVHHGPHPLDRQLDAVAGDILTRHLDSLGIRLETGRSAACVQPGKLVLDDGRHLPWDTLVCCTGVRPRTGLARTAGLPVRAGVLVNEEMRTSDPHIRAVGDCVEPTARVWGLLASGWAQADVAARSLTGHPLGAGGPATLFRLRVPGLSLGVLGVPDLRGDATEGEVVTFLDPARGRYASVALDGSGLLSSAVLIGLPQTLATLTQLNDAGRPLPEDRLALLLGAAAGGRRAATSATQSPDTVLCLCNNVTRHALTRAFQDGARTVRALAGATRVTTGCGTCTDQVRELCAQLTAAVEPKAGQKPPADEGVDDVHDAGQETGDRRLRHDGPAVDRGTPLPGRGGPLADSRPR